MLIIPILPGCINPTHTSKSNLPTEMYNTNDFHIITIYITMIWHIANTEIFGKKKKEKGRENFLF
jgi:hypothetical protein